MRRFWLYTEPLHNLQRHNLWAAWWEQFAASVSKHLATVPGLVPAVLVQPLATDQMEMGQLSGQAQVAGGAMEAAADCEPMELLAAQSSQAMAARMVVAAW